VIYVSARAEQLSLPATELGATGPLTRTVVASTPPLPFGRTAREEQLTILRCPFCSAFLGYKGLGRPRVVCGAQTCRRARKRMTDQVLARRRRDHRLRLTLIFAALVSRRAT
jgi:hypothetical protein